MKKITENEWIDRFTQAVSEAPYCACDCGGRMTPSELGLARWKTLGGSKYQYRKYLSGHQNRNAPHTLSTVEYQVLAGSSLGDGCLFRKEDTYAPIFIENHGPKQEDYVKWKAVQLIALKPTISYGDNSGGYGKEQYVRMRTPAHYCLTPILEARYPEPSTDLINSLEPLGLAVWFMDDGTSGQDKVRLCTNGQSIATIIKMRNLLKDKFGLSTSMQKSSPGFVISFLGKSRQAFCDLVQPHIIPSMEYKLAWRRV